MCVIAPFAVAARKRGRTRTILAHLSCWAVALATLTVWARQDAFYARGLQFDTLEMVAVVVVILGAMELTRRTAGIVVSLIIALFLSYALFWGRYLDGPLGFPGLSIETVLFRSVYTDEGMFGSIAGISASYVFMFVLFGAFLVQSGAGDFILALSRSFSQNFTGGAGFVAVFASAMTGTVSGSAVANTVSTGVVTIPLMKRSGFSPQFAGAVEATASTGGQLMPPVMGAGAFLIASYTQIPYASIVAVSIVPALLFFAAVLVFVRILSGTLAGALWGGLVGLFAILALAISLEGFFERPVPMPMRLSAGALGIALVLLKDPSIRLGVMALLTASLCWLIVASRRELRQIEG